MDMPNFDPNKRYSSVMDMPNFDPYKQYAPEDWAYLTEGFKHPGTLSPAERDTRMKTSGGGISSVLAAKDSVTKKDPAYDTTSGDGTATAQRIEMAQGMSSNPYAQGALPQEQTGKGDDAFLRQGNDKDREEVSKPGSTTDDPDALEYSAIDKRTGLTEAKENFSKYLQPSGWEKFRQFMTPPTTRRKERDQLLQELNSARGASATEKELYLRRRKQDAPDEYIISGSAVNPNTNKNEDYALSRKGNQKWLGENTVNQKPSRDDYWNAPTIDAAGAAIQTHQKDGTWRYVENKVDEVGPPDASGERPVRTERPNPYRAPVKVGNDLVAPGGKVVYDGPDKPVAARPDPRANEITKVQTTIGTLERALPLMPATERPKAEQALVMAKARLAELQSGGATGAPLAAPTGGAPPAEIPLSGGGKATVRRKG